MTDQTNIDKSAQQAPNEDEHRRQIEAFRKQKDKFLLEHPESPILAEDKEEFRGSNYYPVDLKYRVIATLVPEPHPGIFKVQTTTGDHKEYTRIGRLEFEIDGQQLRLTTFMPPADEPLHGNRLFVPFRDKTAGKETYGAGRYIDLNKRPGEEYVLDFNRAYNPYCAYSPYYSCPLPPGENNLPVEIKAGEKIFHE
ncbi:MAG: DUF1684 domain-containing protein [Chloroflexi bacterium]|nr:DUF1684 domain-containing protein [Chloroflexota bacterium]